MASILDISNQLISLSNKKINDEIHLYHTLSILIHKLFLEIRRLESVGVDQKIIFQELQDIREIFGKSIFISRLQNWPRGYQGDFETIEYLCNSVNQTPPNTVEYYLEDIALSHPLVQQHRNKVHWQSQHLLNTISSIQDKNGILSIGSGGCRDLRLIKSALNNKKIKLVINDIDENAISFAKKRLDSTWKNLILIQGDSLRKTREMSKYAPFELIVAGGLFDYLPDKYACLLLKRLSAMLTENGKICFTNILKPNPWKIWMDYLLNWNLLERTEQDFRNMFNAHGINNLEIKMIKDKTSLTGLYEIKKVKKQPPN